MAKLLVVVALYYHMHRIDFIDIDAEGIVSRHVLCLRAESMEA